MKILFRWNDVNGRPSTEQLSAGGREGPSGLDIQSQGEAQVAAYPDSAAVEVFARFNAQTTVSFSVTRLFANSVSADQFILGRGRLVGQKGNLEFTLENSAGGGGGGLVTFADCCCVAARARGIGVSAIATYQFVGGRIT